MGEEPSIWSMEESWDGLTISASSESSSKDWLDKDTSEEKGLLKVELKVESAFDGWTLGENNEFIELAWDDWIEIGDSMISFNGLSRTLMPSFDVFSNLLETGDSSTFFVLLLTEDGDLTSEESNALLWEVIDVRSWVWKSDSAWVELMLVSEELLLIDTSGLVSLGWISKFAGVSDCGRINGTGVFILESTSGIDIDVVFSSSVLEFSTGWLSTSSLDLFNGVFWLSVGKEISSLLFISSEIWFCWLRCDSPSVEIGVDILKLRSSSTWRSSCILTLRCSEKLLESGVSCFWIGVDGVEKLRITGSVS